MAKQAETSKVSESISTELTGDSLEIAKRLFGEVSGGAHKMSKPQFLDYVRRNWQAAPFRQQLLQQIGPHNFLSVWREAFPGAEDALKQVLSGGPLNVAPGSGADTTPPNLPPIPPGPPMGPG